MSKQSAPKSIAPWVWFLNLGLALAFIYFLYFLNSVPETPEAPSVSKDTKSAVSNEQATAPAQPADTAATTDQTFSFYELLPETQVTAPKVEAYQPKKLPDNINYMLQTGSFRKFSDAERQRANIAFQGLKAEVKQISLTASSTWYRVEVGPYKSRSKMNSAIDRLVAINIQPLVKKQVIK